ncbi:hypothetical protein B0T10DRAFT_111057, partial [Thelonectria olida]
LLFFFIFFLSYTKDDGIVSAVRTRHALRCSQYIKTFQIISRYRLLYERIVFLSSVLRQVFVDQDGWVKSKHACKKFTAINLTRIFSDQHAKEIMAVLSPMIYAKRIRWAVCWANGQDESENEAKPSQGTRSDELSEVTLTTEVTGLKTFQPSMGCLQRSSGAPQHLDPGGLWMSGVGACIGLDRSPAFRMARTDKASERGEVERTV